ncbi:hypothetical protein MAP00_002617 [Monascus purpureus]|nr:hypothetical protein MAP00_002617 [Monascus purpureus]
MAHSTVNIAKIEGGPAYRQFVRKAGESTLKSGDNIASPSSSSPSSFSTSSEECRTAGGPHLWSQLRIRGFRDVLPPWLGGHPHPHTTTQSLARMLRSLKTATESYLVDAGFVAGLSTANIIIPFTLSSTYKDVIRTAATSVYLKAPLSGGPPAGLFAVLAQDCWERNAGLRALSCWCFCCDQ